MGESKLRTAHPSLLSTRRAFLSSALGVGAFVLVPDLARAGSGGGIRALAFDGDVLLAAEATLNVSEDSGGTWAERTTPGKVLAMATNPDRPGLVAAGLEKGGVALSTDGGATWRTVV